MALMNFNGKETSMRLLRVLCMFFAAMILLLCPNHFRDVFAADTAATPTFSLVAPVLKLENGLSEGHATMLLKAENFEDTTPLKIIDQEVPMPPPVKVTFSVKEMQVSGPTRSWLLSANITGLPPNTSQKRYLLVQFPKVGKTQEYTLEYTLTNKYDVAFSWTLKPPPSPISIKSGQGIEIGIAVGPVPATDVRVLQANLVEQSRKYPLASAGFMLCKNPIGRCESDISLLPNSANRLWLRTQDDKSPVGQFLGSVTIAASQKPEGDAVNLTVYSSSYPRKIGGIAVIFFSVLASFVVFTYGRYRLNRDQLLLPAESIKQRLKDLEEILSKKPPQIKDEHIANTSDTIADLLRKLEKLETDYVPYRVFQPWGSAVAKLDEYKQSLKTMDDRAYVLDLIVSRGLVCAWKYLELYHDDASKEAINETVHTINNFSMDESLSSGTVRQKIDNELENLKKELKDIQNRAKSLQPFQIFAIGGQPERTYEKIEMEIRRISWAVWILMIVLTTAVGSYIIVLSNLGFGLWTDYLICVFWGVGIPTGTQQLAQSTSSSVASTLGIQITK